MVLLALIVLALTIREFIGIIYIRCIMIIYACLDLGFVYRLEFDLSQVQAAKKILDECPYDGQLYLYTSVKNLKTTNYEPCKIIIKKDIVIATVTYDQNILEPGDDLLSLPSVYVTRRMRVLWEDVKKYLSERDIELIKSWSAQTGEILNFQ